MNHILKFTNKIKVTEIIDMLDLSIYSIEIHSYCVMIIAENDDSWINIDANTREVTVCGENREIAKEILLLLYDLIEKGYIEKVNNEEDKNG